MQIFFFSFCCSHPLFPLLALLLEKCELATNTFDCLELDASLPTDFGVFLQGLRPDQPVMSDDTEVNELVTCYSAQ